MEPHHFHDAAFKVIDSSDQGGGVQIATLPDVFLSNGFVLTQLSERLSLTGFLESVQQSFKLFSDALTGEAKIPAYIFYRGMSLDEVGSQELTGLSLRPWRSGFDEFVPPDAQASRGAMRRRIGFVGVRQVTVKYEFRSIGRIAPPEDDVSPFAKESDELTSMLDTTARNLSLATFLAFDAERASGLHESMRYVLSPFQLPGYSWSRANYRREQPVANEAEINRWKYWYGLLVRTDTAHAAVGLDRIVKAIVHRKDAVDVLIDAVVCWENLFGSEGGELVLRISTAMAKILSDDEQERRSLQKEIKDLYAKRSRIVHGGEPPSSEDAQELSDRVLQITRDMLRKLLADQPGLLDGTRGSLDVLLD